MDKIILIIDDELDIVETLQVRFQAEGFNVLTAFNGQEGLEIIREKKTDLIILDEMMPKMSGRKVCALLKLDRRFNHIPIIMFTNRAEDLDLEVGEQSRADVYLSKIVDFESCSNKWKSCLSGRRL